MLSGNKDNFYDTLEEAVRNQKAGTVLELVVVVTEVEDPIDYIKAKRDKAEKEAKEAEENGKGEEDPKGDPKEENPKDDGGDKGDGGKK